MIEKKITLKNSNPLALCEILNKYKSDFDLYSKRRVIDGKSFLGIFSLNLDEPLTLKIMEKNDEIENILKDLKDYLID